MLWAWLFLHLLHKSEMDKDMFNPAELMQKYQMCLSVTHLAVFSIDPALSAGVPAPLYEALSWNWTNSHKGCKCARMIAQEQALFEFYMSG